MRSASERPSEPPLGERERLVAANDAAVFLAPVAMVGGRDLTRNRCLYFLAKVVQFLITIFELTD